MRSAILLLPIVLLLLPGLAACGGDEKSADNGGGAEASDPAAADKQPPPEPEGTRIKVQHVLIGFQKAPGFAGKGVPPRAVKRKQDDAERLAQEVLSRAQGGFDFSSLVRTYSDDQLKPGDAVPGTYVLVEGRAPAEGEIAREGMVKGFGDTAFSLEVGEIGMAVFDKVDSYYGWHIIKRLE